IREFIGKEPFIFLLFINALGLIWLVLFWGAPSPVVLNHSKANSSRGALAAIRWGVIGLLALGILVPPCREVQKLGFQNRVFRDTAGIEHKYAIFIPRA